MAALVRKIIDDTLALIGEVSGPGVQTFSDDQMRGFVIRGFDLIFKKYYWPQYRKWFVATLDGVTGRFTSDVFERFFDMEDIIGVHMDGVNKQMNMLPKSFNPFSIKGGTTPLYWTSLHATDPQYRTKRLQFYPVTAIGSVNIHIRLHPLAFPVGVFAWTHVTDYVVGQYVYDPVDGSQWQCAVTHTSPVGGTMAAYRASNPTHWTLVTVIDITSAINLQTDWADDDVMDLDKDLLMYAAAFVAFIGDSLNPDAADTYKNLLEMRYQDITTAIARQGIPLSTSSPIPDRWYEMPH